MNTRIKAEIVSVGLVVPTITQGQKDKVVVWLPGEIRARIEQTVTFWEFECLDQVAAIETRGGEILIGGYTVDELREISQEHYGG